MKKSAATATRITKKFWVLNPKKLPASLRKFTPFDTAAIIFPSGENHVFDICNN